MELSAPSAQLARGPQGAADAKKGLLCFPLPPSSVSLGALQRGGCWARAEGRGAGFLTKMLSEELPSPSLSHCVTDPLLDASVCVSFKHIHVLQNMFEWP